jgi:hypothetical protein
MMMDRSSALNQTVSPETALASGLRNFRQRCESAVDRLERINNRFSNAPRAVPQQGISASTAEAMTHERQIDRIEALLNQIHNEIDTLETRV